MLQNKNPLTKNFTPLGLTLICGASLAGLLIVVAVVYFIVVFTRYGY